MFFLAKLLSYSRQGIRLGKVQPCPLISRREGLASSAASTPFRRPFVPFSSCQQLQRCRSFPLVFSVTPGNSWPKNLLVRHLSSHTSLPVLRSKTFVYNSNVHSCRNPWLGGLCGRRAGGMPGPRQPSSPYQDHPSLRTRKRNIVLYILSAIVLMFGLTFLAFPMYRVFCQATGYGGTVQRDVNMAQVETMEPVEERELTIVFESDRGAGMRWNFTPLQPTIKVVPGETALAFYRARNPTDKAIIGISTYNVIPSEAGLYFNKIQCFCFEEQRLEPGEEVDMPVFFYIDPEIMENPRLAEVEDIILSYTFFEAREEEVEKFLAVMQGERDKLLEEAKKASEKAKK